MGASKMISKPVVRSAQTVHLSCTYTKTITKQTEMRFHMTHVTYGFHRCVQNDLRAYGMFGANQAPILRQDYLCLHTD